MDGNEIIRCLHSRAISKEASAFDLCNLLIVASSKIKTDFNDGRLRAIHQPVHVSGRGRNLVVVMFNSRQGTLYLVTAPAK